MRLGQTFSALPWQSVRDKVLPITPLECLKAFRFGWVFYSSCAWWLGKEIISSPFPGLWAVRTAPLPVRPHRRPRGGARREEALWAARSLTPPSFPPRLRSGVASRRCNPGGRQSEPSRGRGERGRRRYRCGLGRGEAGVLAGAGGGRCLSGPDPAGNGGAGRPRGAGV